MMISDENLLRYDAYFVHFDCGVLFITSDGESHVIAHFSDCNRRYDVTMLEGALAQNLHPLVIPHIREDLTKG